MNVTDLPLPYSRLDHDVDDDSLDWRDDHERSLVTFDARWRTMSTTPRRLLRAGPPGPL